MAEFIPDDEARDRRLAAIRARRGTPERLAQIEKLHASKAPEPPPTPRKLPGASGQRKFKKGRDDEPESVAEMRSLALDRITEVTALRAVRTEGQTYRLANGKKFHLRTRQRDVQSGGWVRYWFGIREHLWRPEEFFVLVCDLDFVLVVPVVEWLPYIEHFSISNPGPEQSRQPHIYWRGSAYELREASRSVPLTLDVRPWVNHFSLLS